MWRMRLSLVTIVAPVVLASACVVSWAVPVEGANAPTAWWAALDDPTLDQLLAAAPRDPATDARTVSLYLQVRVYGVRLAIARRARVAAEREWELLRAAGPDQADAARIAGLMVRQAERREHRMGVLLSESVADVAEALGSRYPASVLAVLLQPALETPALAPVADRASELERLADLQDLLQEEDRLAVARGLADLEWVQAVHPRHPPQGAVSFEAGRTGAP